MKTSQFNGECLGTTSFSFGSIVFENRPKLKSWVEWSERVTKLARMVLQQRKLIQKKELPSPDDIETLTRH